MKTKAAVLAILTIATCLRASELGAQSKAIDVNRSSLKIRVFKSGAFSAFAHDHEIEAPIEDGKIEDGKNDPATSSVQLRVDSRKMRVLDPDTSADKRAEIQHTMQSAAVLDVEKFPEISYQSTAVTSHGEGHWEVRGDLSLHGKKAPVTVDVTLQDGHYRGTATLKQTAFGMTPIRIAGGTVKVKDEIKIEFDVVAGEDRHD